jgi:hypothetical protein
MWFDLLVQWHEETVRRPRYQVLMLPKPQVMQRKVLYYDSRKPVPEVAPEKPFGASKAAQGEKDAAGRTLVAQSPKPASRRQFIWQPKHPEPIPADIPAPNLAALFPAVPPAPKAPLKVFTPPPADRPKAHPALVVEPPPPVYSSVANLRDERVLRELARHDLELAKKPPLKQFVPPALESKPSSGPPILMEPPPVPAQTGTGGAVQAVIVGLNPADRFSTPVPDGSRSAQFARASAAGSPSSGSSVSPDALRAPGVIAHASPGQPIDAAAARPASAVPEHRTLTEILFPPVNRTMSAPLRPSSRIVPATVEAKFASRDVYAFVIPGPRLAGYAGDWVLWFAPHQAEAGVGARIQAPIPARKENSSGDTGADQESNGKGSIQFQAIIDAKGRVLSPQILRGLTSEPFRRRAAAELLTWEFKPSLRNGEPIDVDVVLEIPFEFRSPVAQTR